ncbi:MAG: hypothetical protein ACHQ2Z_01130 [Elusimicrobiota bacterium]
MLRNLMPAEEGRVLLDFKEERQFSELYCVRANDDGARDAFDANVFEFMEAHPGWHIESAGNRIVLYRSRFLEVSGGFVASADFAQFVRDAGAIARIFSNSAGGVRPAAAKEARTKNGKCRACGAEQALDADSNYCDQCGAALAAAPLESAANPPVPDGPTNGVCPKCGGPVVEVSLDLGVCKKCGEELVSTESRSRKRWGLFIALAAAAIYIIGHALFGPHRWNF